MASQPLRRGQTMTLTLTMEGNVPMNTHELETVWAPRMLAILRIVAALIFMEHTVAVRLPALGASSARAVLAAGLPACSSFRRHPPPARAVHPPGRVHPVRRDGGRVLMAHAPQSFFPAVNGDAAILIALFLYLVVAGGGAWSLDNAMRSAHGRYRRRAEPVAPDSSAIRERSGQSY
jgi:putative oxidoreductase